MKHGATDPGKHVVVANVPLPDEDSGVDDAKHRREPRPSERIVNPNNDPTSVGAVTLLAKHRNKNLRVGHQRITVGSDCAGMGSELFALRGLGVNFQHCWASDIEPHVKKFHEAVHGCKAQWFDSIAQRNAANTCATDLYVAGFPCQPFSNAGRNAGIHDTRGNVFFEIAAHLEKALPRAFVLENVFGLTTTHWPTFNLMLEMFSKIQLKDKPGQPSAYAISWKILETSMHGGLPHHRLRVYVVGVRVDSLVAPMVWPEPTYMTPLSNIINVNDAVSNADASKIYPPKSSTTLRANVISVIRKVRKENPDVINDVVIDGDSSKTTYMIGKSPCLTRSRAGSGGFWLPCLGKRMGVKYVAKLQGYDYDYLLGKLAGDGKTPILTDRELGLMLGNAMTLPLLQRVLGALLRSAGLDN